jgi:hypothetical protein
MGERLYQPGTGRFMSVDLVDGGSCNSYDYVCADPTNKYDLDGKWIVPALRGAATACKVARNWCLRSAKWVGSKMWQGVEMGLDPTPGR